MPKPQVATAVSIPPNLTDALTTNTAVEICRAIKGIDLDIRSASGTTLINDVTGQVIYTPPQGETRLRGLLTNWEKFLHDSSGADPFIRMAIAHYQFEAIHPFSDGRTGRIINLLYLVEQGLLDLPVLYLSRAIIQRKAEYYRLLRAVTAEQRWEEWILYMLIAVSKTAAWTTAKIRAMRKLIQDTIDYVKGRAPDLYTYELIELIFAQPSCRIANLVEAGIAHRQTASVYLKRLCAIDVLEEIKLGREKLFINPRLMALLKSERYSISPFPGRPEGEGVANKKAP